MRMCLLILAALAMFTVPAGQNPTKLKPDGRAGIVIDLQGFATLRPAGRQRWTTVNRGMVLMPGDQLRISARGANAVELRLGGGGKLTAGPGSLTELEASDRIHLLRGDIELEPQAGRSMKVRAPGGYTAEVREATILRTAAKTEVLVSEPRWLTGYRSSTTDEWLGSLVAQVDGREVPLSVGYHKVEVDIKDQIARTTVEQSFVNATRSRLEGVFYFPLPAGASISGFGMWIGGELVEADIVEKQRAREIFEDILRRKKDPALLEWSGGNLFKARVFPIEAHSEKRIRIRYTQALTRQGESLRYRYALRSELLRAHPLRELSIRVTIDSEMPIAQVSSTSHELRIRKTKHNAVAEFDAQEFTPQRDFELDVRIDAEQAVTMIPHRRGDDGYFMMQFTPPGSGRGGMMRRLTAEGEPVKLLILTDTSASMNRSARKAQASFLQGLLAMLSENDSFRLLTVDLAVRPFRADAVPATEKNIAQALRFLEARASLGWTDLDLAFVQATKLATIGTTIIYLGDGIDTTSDADPIALAKRIRRLQVRDSVSCHAVSISSTYEQPVLEAIASIGGGSFREMGGDPLETAGRILAEAAQPTIKDLQIAFEGLQVARVYPERLPNLAAGSQLTILGRYLPTDKAQAGRVLIQGRLAGKQVKFSAKVALPSRDAGNSFIPRLWARKHVDALLNEGRNAQVIADIVDFSREFGIMTPYTSLLVLESDADRERYGVDRLVKMRDGERFFAAGRDRANLEILRQQMDHAKTWRIQLWRRMAREIEGLGEDLYTRPVAYAYGGMERDGFGRGVSEGKKRGSFRFDERMDRSYDLSNAPFDAKEHSISDPDHVSERQLGVDQDLELADIAEEMLDMPLSSRAMESGRLAANRSSRLELAKSISPDQVFGDFGGAYRTKFEHRRNAYFPNYGFTHFHFPQWPVVPPTQTEIDTPQWPAAVLEVLAGMDRRRMLGKQGIAFTLVGESMHHLRGHRVQLNRVSGMLSSDEWFLGQRSRGSQATSQWLFAGQRGVLARDFGLGRRREAMPSDQQEWPMPLADYSLRTMVRRYRAYQTKLTTDAQGRSLLILTAPENSKHRLELSLDLERHIVLESRNYQDDALVQTIRFIEYAQVADQWWPRSIETRNADGRLMQRQSMSVEALTTDAFKRRVAVELPDESTTLFLDRPDPKLVTAKQAIHEGKGDFADHLRLALTHMKTQRWDRAWEAFDAASTEIEGKLAAPWLRTVLMSMSRRGEDFKVLLYALSDTLDQQPQASRIFVAETLCNLAAGSLQAEEQARILTTLRHHYFAPGADLAWRKQAWHRRHAQNLTQRQRNLQALTIYESLIEAHPNEMADMLRYIQIAPSQGMAEQAIAMGRQRLDADLNWNDYELYQLYERLSSLLWDGRRLQDLDTLLTQWVAREPTQEVAYQRYLSVLMFLGRMTDADRWISQRFAEELSAEMDQAQIARIAAAIQLSLGQGWQFHGYRLEEKWIAPLKVFALRLAASETHAINLVGRILNHHLFRGTDAHQEVRDELGHRLMVKGAVASMSVQRLSRYVNWIDWRIDRVDVKLWQHMTAQLSSRWESDKALPERPQIAQLLTQILDQHGARYEALAFTRRRLERCTELLRPQVARELMARLSTEPWTVEIEAELFALVTKLVPAEIEKAARAELIATTVRQLAHSLSGMRTKSLMGPREDYERLTRSELRAKQRMTLRQARLALATGFGVAAESAVEADRIHYELERLCFAIRLQEDPAKRDGEARQIMAALNKDAEDSLSRVLRQRASLIMAYAATRGNAPIELPARLLTLYQQEFAENPALLNWRYEIFRLLVVLDRPDELERALRSWIVPGQVASEWQIALGYLLAEAGRMREATQAFEQVQAKDELGSRELAILSKWYASLGEDERSENAKLAQYRSMSEQALSQRLYALSNRLSRQGEGVPATFDPDSLRVLEVLLSKATHPHNYIHQISNLYSQVKDFRLLASLVNGILGHSAQQVYPFLMQSMQVIGAVHEEATCDLLSERIEALIPMSQGVDLRALQLLAFMVERRATEVLNAPGPHGDIALAKMQQAFKGKWLPGERRMMAGYLASLGRIPLDAVASEQLRQLEALHQAETGIDRLKIAHHLSQTLWQYGRQDDAANILWIALAERHGNNPQAFSQETNAELGTLLSWWHARHRLTKAEQFLERQLASKSSRSQHDWFLSHLFTTYLLAMEHGNALVAGQRATLYPVARQRIQEALSRSGPQHMQSMMAQFLRLHRLAKARAGVAHAGTDLEVFAGNPLTELLSRSNHDRQSLVQQVGTELRYLNGPLAGLRLYIEQLEAEPTWFARLGRSGWQSYGYYLAQWRQEAGDLADLQPRLLKIVLTELERDLVTQQPINRSMYQINSGYFWAEQRHHFVTIAERVLDQKLNSATRQLYVAEYFWHGLRMHERAIDVLFAADRRTRLSVDGRYRLVGMLHNRGRWAESIPLLERLIENQTDRVDYRISMVLALHRDRQDQRGRTFFDVSVKGLRDQNRMDPTSLASFAQVGLTCGYWQRSIDLYEELVPLHQATAPSRGIGDGMLSQYYGELARAYAGIGRSVKAVTAASAAVVAWGRNQANRQAAIASLESVLRQIPDLSAYEREWDAQVASSGMDSALIRRSLGRIHLRHRSYQAAIANLLSACALQPEDNTIYGDLLLAYDGIGDAEGAITALGMAIQASPLHLDHYQQLARRFEARGDDVAAERALTSLVEVLPGEADSHRRLAVSRESARRYAEAVVQWLQVVRIRSMEPNGWHALARAQALAGQRNDALASLRHILETTWALRFGDVHRRARQQIREMDRSGPPR